MKIQHALSGPVRTGYDAGRRLRNRATSTHDAVTNRINPNTPAGSRNNHTMPTTAAGQGQ